MRLWALKIIDNQIYNFTFNIELNSLQIIVNITPNYFPDMQEEADKATGSGVPSPIFPA